MQEAMNWAMKAAEAEVTALNLEYPDRSSVIDATEAEWETRLNELQTKFNKVLESIQPYEAFDSDGLVQWEVDMSANGASDFETDLLNALNDRYMTIF